MAASAAKIAAVLAGLRKIKPVAPPVAHSWSRQTLSGRLSEVSGSRASAVLTVAFELVLDAQREAESVAWVTQRQSCFFPLDVAACGADLDALLVVRLQEAAAIPRAADQLARSGAFGLIILDLAANAIIPMALQSRLLGLAQKHDIAIVCLSEKSPDTASLGSLISLRALAERRREQPRRFSCSLQIAKDKRRSPDWQHTQVRRGSAGLR